jgi:CTP-dependent riboflavin kinase
LNDLLAESGILLNEITVVDGAFILGLGFDPQLQLIFDNYASAINDVLGNEDFINALNNALDPNNKEAEELINQLSEIQQKISQNEPVTPEDVNKLVQEFDDLSNEEQDAFFSAMQAFIDPSLVEDFENSFNN